MRNRPAAVGVVAMSVGYAASAVAYVIACQWLMTRSPPPPWGALVVVGPMLALLGVHTWKHGQRAVTALCALGFVGLCSQSWRGGGVAPSLLYVLQHVAIHLGLGLFFALTLRRGQEPLITALARRVHGKLTPAMQAYSRRVTTAWVVYFGVMAALSVVLFVAAPFDVWAAFANFATPLGVALLFIGEYLLRYRLHPEFERATLRAAMDAYARRDVSP